MREMAAPWGWALLRHPPKRGARPTSPPAARPPEEPECLGRSGGCGCAPVVWWCGSRRRAFRRGIVGKPDVVDDEDQLITGPPIGQVKIVDAPRLGRGPTEVSHDRMIGVVAPQTIERQEDRIVRGVARCLWRWHRVGPANPERRRQVKRLGLGLAPPMFPHAHGFVGGCARDGRTAGIGHGPHDQRAAMAAMACSSAS